MLLFEYIEPGYAFIKQLINNRFSEHNDEMKSGIKAGLAGFIGVLLLCFVVGWLPYITNKRKHVQASPNSPPNSW